MFTSTWMFALAVTYTVVFNLLLLPAAFMIIHALLNLQVICFRSLGKEYLCCLLVTGLLLHFISIGAVWHLALVPDEARVIVVNGSLTGVRLMISGVMYGVLCSRQFVLARIFGRLKGGGRIHTSSWRFLIFAVVAWMPLMVLFYVSLFLDFSVEYFGAFVFLYYFIYTAAFAYLCHKNKGINKIFSDYYRNIMTVVSIVALLLVTLWVTIQYQIVSVQTYVFEVAMCYGFGAMPVVCFFFTIATPYIMWRTDPDKVKNWEEFNKTTTIDVTSTSVEIMDGQEKE